MTKYVRLTITALVACTILLSSGIRPGSADTLRLDEGIADSTREFSLVQNQNAWQYGYYAGGNLAGFTQLTVQGNFWGTSSAGELMTIGPGDEGVPNGSNTGTVHWVVRRYTSEVAGDIQIDWFVRKLDITGDGVSGKVVIDGAEMDSVTLISNDDTGVFRSLSATVSVGSTIDFVLTPVGFTSDTDYGDRSAFGGRISTNSEFVTLVLAADSVVDFAGIQGTDDWSYGVYDLTANGPPDPGGDDFVPFPNDGGPHSESNYWNGAQWDWFEGPPPWTWIAATASHPNGTNNGVEHWATRRYTVPQGQFGDLLVEWILAKQNVSPGTGATGYVLHNGIEVDSAGISFDDTTGIWRGVVLDHVSPGDVIDLSLAPLGPFGDTDDSADASYHGAKIHLLYSDLSLTNTDGDTTATPGGTVTYIIQVLNAGPRDVFAASVSDVFPAEISSCSWTCLQSGGASCTPGPVTDHIDDSVDLPVGSMVTYVAPCSVGSSATGHLINTATVTSSILDSDPSNDSATDVDLITPRTDLGISKTDGQTTADPGGTVTYIVTASNSGPIAVDGAVVTDSLPPELTCTWTCVASAGATCAEASGLGDLDHEVDLAVGSTATFVVSCDVDQTANGLLVNTASIAPPSGVTDPNLGNNGATDVDVVGEIPFFGDGFESGDSSAWTGG